PRPACGERSRALRRAGEGRCPSFVVLAPDPKASLRLPSTSPRERGEVRPGISTMLTETSDYDELYRHFRWEVPEHFNIATAACDRHADGTGRLALTFIDEAGGVRRVSFDEMQAWSRRFANVLTEDGLLRGDRVGVFLSQSVELPVAHLA